MNNIFKNFVKKVSLVAVIALSFASFAPAISASAATNCVHGFNWTTGKSYSPGTFCSTDNNGGYVVFQGDGNLVWYINGVAAWNSKTYAHGTLPAGSQLAFQSDSNFVVYASSGKALWASSYLGGWKATGASVQKQLSTYYYASKHYFAHNVNTRDNWSMVR